MKDYNNPDNWLIINGNRFSTYEFDRSIKRIKKIERIIKKINERI